MKLKSAVKCCNMLEWINKVILIGKLLKINQIHQNTLKQLKLSKQLPNSQNQPQIASTKRPPTYSLSGGALMACVNPGMKSGYYGGGGTE